MSEISIKDKYKIGDVVDCAKAAYVKVGACEEGRVVGYGSDSTVAVKGMWKGNAPSAQYFVFPSDILRHIPADEPMPAPNPVTVGDGTRRDPVDCVTHPLPIPEWAEISEAPQPVRLGDKPAREMTVRERLICDLFVRSFQWQEDSNRPALRHPDDCIMDADALLAALEGSAGK